MSVMNPKYAFNSSAVIGVHSVFSPQGGGCLYVQIGLLSGERADLLGKNPLLNHLQLVSGI